MPSELGDKKIEIVERLSAARRDSRGCSMTKLNE